MVVRAAGNPARTSSVTVKLATSRGHDRGISVELSSEPDPFFLYTLNLSENDFETLKSDQRLLIDLEAFPTKFIELLEACIAGDGRIQRLVATLTLDGPEAESCIRGMPASRNETQHCETGCAVLSLVETNQFKELTHLYLRFRKGDDDLVKAHLAARLDELKVLRDGTEATLRAAETYVMQLEEKLSEADRCKAQMKADEARVVEELQLRREADMDDARSQNAKNLEVVKAHLENAETRAQQSSVESAEYVRQLQEVSRDLERAQASLKRVSEEAEEWQRNATDARAVLREQEQALVESRNRLAAAEDQLQAKEGRLESTLALLEQGAAQRTTLEESLASARTTNSQLQEKLTRSIDEINKGNSIIERLQNQLRTYKSKVRSRESELEEARKAISDGSAAGQEAEARLQELEPRLRAAEEREKALRLENSTLAEKLERGQELLANNQHVITVLNKQLNEKEVQSVLAKYGTKPSTDCLKLGAPGKCATYPGAAANLPTFPKLPREEAQHSLLGTALLSSKRAAPASNAPTEATIGGSNFPGSADSRPLSAPPPSTGLPWPKVGGRDLFASTGTRTPRPGQSQVAVLPEDRSGGSTAGGRSRRTASAARRGQTTTTTPRNWGSGARHSHASANARRMK
eukprot:Polyplicarium_translucidae@DN3072_c0_g1_i3.p1